MATHPPACVLPVAHQYALLWAEGRLDDRHLLLNAPLLPEAVFILDLPDLRAYADCVQRCALWRDLGAVCMITRTGTDVVRRHIMRFGGVPLAVEKWGAYPKTRFLAPPEAFRRWLARV